MKKYLVLYQAPVETSRRMADTTPEQQAEGMKAWDADCTIELHEAQPIPGM